MESISYFAKTDFRNANQKFGIKQNDRLSHMYIIGKTGTGKTTLLETMIYQDIQQGRGMAYIDPHGDSAERVRRSIPEHMKDRLIYLDIPNIDSPWGYNPLKSVPYLKRPLVASGILEIFKKLYDGRSWGVRMEHIFRNVLLTLLDQPKTDFTDIPRILLDKSYRQTASKNIVNPSVREFWLNEYEKYPHILRANAIAPIQNKIGGFLSNPIIKRFLIGYEKEISFREIMDSGKILLVNLAKGKIGEDAAYLLGGLIITSIGLAAFSRSNIQEPSRRPFMLFVDEFQNFTTLSLINMLSELRKFKVGLILANQYLHQLEKDIREAVLGNVGTIISFRLGPADAKYMATEFYPTFKQDDLVRLPNYRVYLKLMIDGTPSKPFSSKTLINRYFKQ